MRKGIHTSEFRLLAVFLLSSIGLQQFMKDIRFWAAALTVICCGYFISRGLFKRSRGSNFQKEGHKTTEFSGFIVSCSLIFESVKFYALPLDFAFLCAAIQFFFYAISRGHAKAVNISIKHEAPSAR